MLLKKAREIILIGKADRSTDLRNGIMGIQMKISGFIHAQIRHIQMRCRADDFFEKMGKAADTVTAFLSLLIIAHILSLSSFFDVAEKARKRTVCFTQEGHFASRLYSDGE